MPAEPHYGRLFADGLWHNNPALVQILGLCPLLAVTGSVANGLGMGLATTVVLLASNTTVSLIRGLVRPEVRIPVYVLVIASFVTAVELLMNAWFYDLYKVLGIFVPLIVTNCTIIGRAEAFASRNRVVPAAADGLAMGLGFTAVLVVLGGLRELLGQGTLFAQAGIMFGDALAALETTVIPDYRGFLVAALPPGAFLGMGLLIALKNVIDRHIERRRTAAAAAPAPAPQAGAGA